MKLVVVTGLSGAGKTQILKVLEDIGFYCVDNLPPAMIPELMDMCLENQFIAEAAVGVDIRGGVFFQGVETALRSLDDKKIRFEVLYLEASNQVLLNRYKETRRSHPLERFMTIEEAIEKERETLRPLYKRANMIIDTSNMRVKELWQTALSLYRPEEATANIAISLVSFGFKHGIPPEADLVFDARFLPNPFYIPEMRELTGLDNAVYDYVLSFPETARILEMLSQMILYVLPSYVREGNKYPCIAVGCTGGRHRSVSLARALENMLGSSGYRVETRHRDIAKELS